MAEHDKISKFLDAIHREAEERRGRITEQTDAFKKAELHQAETEALDEAYHLIQHEIADARTEIKRETTTKELEVKRRLLEHREQLVNQVFEKARLRLTAFTQTSGYKNVLINYARHAASFFDNQPVTVFIRPADGSLQESLLQALPESSSVLQDESIELGGIKVAAQKVKTIADYTFDNALEQEHASFYKHSELTL